MRETPTIREGSKSHKILKLLVDRPLSRGELAEGLGIQKKIYTRDFEKEKELYIKRGRKGTPPRRNTTVYPKMDGYLSFMSRGKARNGSDPLSGNFNYQRLDLDDPEELKRFIQVEKPLILPTKDRKWEITQWGIRALRQLEGQKN